ncbi:hypothetical protein [Subtercola boreus]|uniref:Uncharacterized protein n=1 Tax=Subtercola boreus TaxID=120213 RepID=A0A3E0W8Q4_9MICO|nr:hypothetical protein [Subtercola boreus]RFA18275.1 hypothetical protein B7R23_14615 [Subtercola boreus]RFA18667.1 hypothetical protein B7R24_14575 [Subtercola boreus]RFA25270.1 hypothetical protein B7R25_14610 [Subtercola boreus]
MASIVHHTLRARAGAFSGFRPEGWNPLLRFVLLGPVPAGAELVWVMNRPGGALWFEHRQPLDELAADSFASVDLQHWVDGVDSPDAGATRFTVRVVSELDGVDELLHDGVLSIVSLDDDQRFAVDNEWMHGVALLALDTIDEPDAPALVTTIFTLTDAEAHQYEAHLFREGARLARASGIESRYAFTANDGSVLGYELAISFDGVRGWNNLSGSGWGGDWHLLDANDGHYEVKVLCASRVILVVPFEVAAGRLVATGRVELDPAVGAVLVADAFGSTAGQTGSLPGTRTFSAGDPPAAHGATVDDVYRLRAAGAAADARAAGDVPGDETAASFRALLDRAERLIATWEHDLVGTLGPFDNAQVLGAEAVLAERAGYRALADAAAAVPDDHPVDVNTVPTTIGELRSRVEAIFAAAAVRISCAGQNESDERAPYRALLTGDRLAVFDDHPAPDFLYTTVGRRLIETPEELAAAEYWFFEGPLDLPGSATVDGEKIAVSVQGWRVLGWRFAPDGSTVDMTESQGQGPSAPLSAFQPRG